MNRSEIAAAPHVASATALTRASVAARDVAREERVARAYLLTAAAPPAPALAAFVAECGPVAAARAVWSGEVPRAVARETRERRRRRVSAADLERACEQGLRLVIPEDSEWPGNLLSLRSAGAPRGSDVVAPLALWVRGRVRLDAALRRAVTVVGSRQATGHGMKVATDIAYQLAAAGTTVVSGGVAGIDATAHRAALAADGVTVAVLGYGLGLDLPHAHLELLREIADNGLLISEYALDAEATRRSYLARNRLIAALSHGTVLVERNVRSGAHLVATEAHTLGRPVVIPLTGPPAAVSPACAAMLRAGSASPARSAGEITQIMCSANGHSPAREVTNTGWITPTHGNRPQSNGYQRVPPRDAGRGDPARVDVCQTETLPTGISHRPARSTGTGSAQTGNARQVYEALDAEAGKSAEEIAQETGLLTLKVRALLAALELDGYCERRETGWHRRDPEA